MKFSYVLTLAFKNLSGRKMRTTLTIVGVAISTGFICFLLSFGLGLQKVSTDQIANIDDLKMLDVSAGTSKIVSIDEDTLNKIKNFSEVESTYPQVSLASDVEYNGSKIDGVTYGMNRDLLDILKPTLGSGKLYDNTDSNSALINATAARKLGQTDPAKLVGKTVTVNFVLRPELFSEPKTDIDIKKETFVIKGIIDEGTTPYLYVPLSTISGYGVNNYSAVKVKLTDKTMVEKIKPQIEHMGFKVSSIKDTVDQVNQFFNVFRVILVAFGTVAIIVAALGMFNTLTISLLEKTREVGLMKVLGTRQKDIWRVFISESLLIGLVGGIIGIIISLVLGGIINLIIASMAKATGNDPVSLFYFPISFILIVLGIAVLISLLTGMYPSRRATKISPLNAMRYE